MTHKRWRVTGQGFTTQCGNMRQNDKLTYFWEDVTCEDCLKLCDNIPGVVGKMKKKLDAKIKVLDNKLKKIKERQVRVEYLLGKMSDHGTRD